MKFLDTKPDFDKHLKDNQDRLVVVLFTALWSAPAQKIAPSVEKLAGEFSTVSFVAVDIDKNAETAQSLEVRSLPTFLFFKGGKQIETIGGANEALLRDAVKTSA